MNSQLKRSADDVLERNEGSKRVKVEGYEVDYLREQQIVLENLLKTETLEDDQAIEVSRLIEPAHPSGDIESAPELIADLLA